MPTKSKSRTTTRRKRTRGGRDAGAQRLPSHRPPTHPGEMLLKEFLQPLGLTQTEFAARLQVSYPRLNEIIRGRRSVSPDTALRLARVLGTSAEFWLGLQLDWDLWHAMRSKEADEIAKLRPLARKA
ncbi:MAG: HigA family addiction module antitoxin [Planctomycetota bacterium]